MFSLCMLESEADEVTLQGVTSVGLKHALDFAYTGQVSKDTLKYRKNTAFKDLNVFYIVVLPTLTLKMCSNVIINYVLMF